MFSKLRKHFAVKPNVCFFKKIDKAAVGNIALICCRAYFNVPKFSKVSFLFSPVMKRVRIGVQQSFTGCPLF